MNTAPATRKAPKVRPARRERVAFARAIETTAEGKAPHAVRLWRAGLNQTTKGPLYFTPRSAKLVMEAYARRGNPLVFDYEHESMLPLEKQGGAPMRGEAASKAAALEVRPDEEGKPELWATGIDWTAAAAEQIESGKRRQISPVSDFDTATREIIEIVNAALCREGATHHGTLLASAGRDTSKMDDLIQALLDALNASDFEAAENIVQQMEAQEGGAGMAKMARSLMAKAKPAPVAPPPPVEDVATKKLAATGYRAPAAGTMRETFAHEIATLEAATTEAKAAARDSRRATVGMLITSRRDLFDPVDERKHLAKADPEATRDFIDSIDRKIEKGTLAASAGAPKVPAAPPKDGAKVDETHGLTEPEMQTAVQHGVSFKDFAASKARHAPRKGN